jgi:ankyrin repeat protein
VYDLINIIMIWKSFLGLRLILFVSVAFGVAEIHTLMNTPSNDVFDKRNDDYYKVFLEEKSPEYLKVKEGEENEELEALKVASKGDRSALFQADDNLWQPIHEAARSGYFSTVMFLLQEGADINALTATKDTPLDLVIFYHGEEHPFVTELTDRGALSGADILIEKTYDYYDYNEDNKEEL